MEPPPPRNGQNETRLGAPRAKVSRHLRLRVSPVEQEAQENKMTEAERKAATILVQICLDKGYYISVSDGEEWVVRRSKAFDEIIDALGSTDNDVLCLYDSDLHIEGHANKGWFQMIYGNRPDELVSDYLANDVCEEIWQEWQATLAKKSKISAIVRGRPAASLD